MPIIPDPIEAYARAHSSAEDTLFEELARETRAKSDMHTMQSGHMEGSLLRLFIQLLDARRVLEIGTFTGYSALTMAMGLPDAGELITCDVDPEMTAIAKSFWARSPHGKKITLKLGPALDSIATLDGPFDFVFIDADKLNYTNYWNACVPLVRPGGLLAIDNVLWSGKVLDPKDDHACAIDAFNQTARNDPRTHLIMLTIRDGLTVARKLP